MYGQTRTTESEAQDLFELGLKSNGTLLGMLAWLSVTMHVLKK